MAPQLCQVSSPNGVDHPLLKSSKCVKMKARKSKDNACTPKLHLPHRGRPRFPRFSTPTTRTIRLPAVFFHTIVLSTANLWLPDMDPLHLALIFTLQSLQHSSRFHFISVLMPEILRLDPSIQTEWGSKYFNLNSSAFWLILIHFSPFGNSFRSIPVLFNL